jgi:hypothetical protein
MRLVTDCLAEATTSYWERRAAAFFDAMPRPGDFNGRATAEDLSASFVRCAGIVQACRQRAQVSLWARSDPITPEVTEFFADVA